MATETTNIGLVKPDLNDNFSLKQHLNDNWDKLETVLTQILDLITSGVENVQVSPDYSSQEQAVNSYTVETQLLDKKEVDI